MNLFSDAILFAATCHSGQYRKDGKTPYINHPLQVVHHLVHLANVQDEDTLCAAVLHDVVEDTDVTAADIELRFNSRISSIVLELTDQKHLSNNERKLLQIENARFLTPEARLIRISDKICNVYDMHKAPPSNWPISQRLNYVNWALTVVDCIRGSNATLESRFDDVVRNAWQDLSRKPQQLV